MRQPRIKIPGHAAGYHIVTRVNNRDFRLNGNMKQTFINYLYKLRNLYYVEYAAFSILDNHYHILVRFADSEDIDPKDAMERWNSYHADSIFTRNEANPESRAYVVEQLTDVSSFMKRLNYHLTAKYNYNNNTQGTLWERRFSSSVVERGYAMAMCAAYIDLNAFRASIAPKPEQYKWSSINWLKRGNPDNLIATHLLLEGMGCEEGDLYTTYKGFVYTCGSSPHKEKPNGLIISKAMQERLQELQLQPDKGALSVKLRTYIDGKVTAGYDFAIKIYDSWINPGLKGQARKRHAARWLGDAGKQLWNVCSAEVRGSP